MGAWVHGGGGPAAYSWYMRVGICGGRAYSGYMGQVGQLLSGYTGAEVQLLTVGTWGQGGQLLSGYMGARGSSCLQWVHGSRGVQLLIVGTWGHGGMDT